jgi:hypothetical protein
MRLAKFALSISILSTMSNIGFAQQPYDPGGYMGGVAQGNSQGVNEPMYPYDSQEPWVHGYWQEMPHYGGYTYFSPYNYKQVLAQSQTAAGWGMNPKMPYSQQFWHRYQQQAAASPYETYGYSTGQGEVFYPKIPQNNQKHTMPPQMPLQTPPGNMMPMAPTPQSMPQPVNPSPNMSTAPITYQQGPQNPVYYPQAQAQPVYQTQPVNQTQPVYQTPVAQMPTAFYPATHAPGTAVPMMQGPAVQYPQVSYPQANGQQGNWNMGGYIQQGVHSGY